MGGAAFSPSLSAPSPSSSSTQKPSHLSDALLLASHGDGGGGGDTFYTLLSSADYRLRWEINLLEGLFPPLSLFLPFSSRSFHVVTPLIPAR